MGRTYRRWPTPRTSEWEEPIPKQRKKPKLPRLDPKEIEEALEDEDRETGKLVDDEQG